MFKSRRRQAEEEAKKDPNYIPTDKLESTEPIEKEPVSKAGIIVIVSLTVLVIICLVVVLVLKK